MALPPLDHFLSNVPAYELAISLGEITQALGQPAAAAPSHILVTDDEHRPLGAIALGRLWASHHTWGLHHAGDNSLPGPRLLDCQPWLEPVVEVEASQLLDTSALANLGALAQKMPAPTLVVIDSDGQYLGVINPTRLLGWLASQSTGISEASQPGTDWLEAGQRAWVLELSHALKTPITTLLGLSTLLLDSRVGSLSDRQFRYVSLMRQAIRKLTTLVNLLLDWMRLESDQIALTLERVSLQPLADTLLSSFLSAQPEVAASWTEGFTVRLATAEGWVMADPLRLRQSLHYGLGYLLAHGARPSGLMVEPWGPWIGFSLDSPDALATAGAEYGAAPRPEALPEFQTLQELGLTLARRFSQLHGGEVSLFSSPAWGSRLTLLLPAPPALARAQTTVLVLLACASEAVVEQVYGCLRGTDYRLVIAPCCQSLTAMQRRLAPTCTLIHWESLPDAPSDAAARQALVDNLEIANPVVLRPAAADQAAALASAARAEGEDRAGKVLNVLSIETLAQGLRPALDQLCQRYPVPLAGLTLLLLRSPEAVAPPSGLSAAVQTWLQRYRCRLLQADDLAQANLLSRVWQPQAIVLDSTEPMPLAELQALARYPALAQLPLVTLVPGSAEAAALGLTLVPCLEVLRQPPEAAVRSLMQAIAMHQATPDA